MEIFYLSIIAVFGLMAGSFLNALIYRLYSKESIVRGRSHCISCDKILTWYELVPVFSFLAQMGKCRGCGKKISWQYPMVEIITALLFLQITNYKLQITNILSPEIFVETFFLFFVISGLIVIFVYDLKHFLIPDKVLIPLIFVVLFAEVFGFWSVELIWDLSFGIWNFGSLFNALAVGILSAIPFALLHFLSGGKAMGFGDVKLAFFMGLFLGYPAILVAMFIAFILGAIIGVGMIIAGQSTMKSKVPFGPFLIVGTLSALFWSKDLIFWYLNLFY